MSYCVIKTQKVTWSVNLSLLNYPYRNKIIFVLDQYVYYIVLYYCVSIREEYSDLHHLEKRTKVRKTKMMLLCRPKKDAFIQSYEPRIVP